MAGMASGDEGVMPCVGLFSQCGGGARLSRPRGSGADLSFDPMLRRSAAWARVRWTHLGGTDFRPRAPFFFVRACHGSGDRGRLGSGPSPHDHLVCHALLGSSVAGPDPLGLAFYGHRISEEESPKNLRRRISKEDSSTCVKPSKIFIIASTYDIMTSWQVSWFSDFVCFL